MNLPDCYSIADRLEGENDIAREAINFAAYKAEFYRRLLRKLAWACREKNMRKRHTALHVVVAELRANDDSTADLPKREKTMP